MSTSSVLAFPDPQLLIGQTRPAAISGGTFVTIDPATEDVIAHVAEAGPDDVDLAVRSACAALESDPWGSLRASQRGRLMRRLAELVAKRESNIVAIESLDGSKPITSVRRQDFPAIVNCLEYYAGWCDKCTGTSCPPVPTR